MATKKNANKQPVSNSKRQKPIKYEVLGIGLIIIGILIAAATSIPGTIQNALLHGTQFLFGHHGAWMLSLALIASGISILIHLSHENVTATFAGAGMIFFVLISLFQLPSVIKEPLGINYWTNGYFGAEKGGLFGCAIAWSIYSLLGKLAWVLLIGIGLIGISLLTDVKLWTMFTWPFITLWRGIVAIFAISKPAFKRDEVKEKVEQLKKEEIKSKFRPVEDSSETEEEKEKRILSILVPKNEKQKPIIAEPIVPPVPVDNHPDEAATIAKQADKIKGSIVGVPSKGNPEQMAFPEKTATKEYVLPPTSLLSVTPKPKTQVKEDMREHIKSLEDTLLSFGIEAKVEAVERGPRVTRFEVIPPPGIRISRITNLANDIALALKALDVRIEAPVPGKGVIGIEVPNKEAVIVDLKEIIDSEVMQKNKSPLAFALGRDIAGHPRIADITKMPHILIAGQTNSGKSVCINTLLCSILMRATPKQVKFLLIDPKRVELTLYQEIPHLIAPVAYDAKHAAGLLRWAIREMEQRYQYFAEKGVRNISGFNELAKLEGLDDMHYIVIIIDELADLMMTAGAEIETSICRIAQLARATGIHLVVATQRPSVNVITGTIKANIPSRLSFAVASQVDSRTILDMNGAERLVGQGDMLYLPVEANKPSRIQGAYMTEAEINRVVQHVKDQGRPFFSDEIAAIEEDALREETDGEYGNDAPDDELFTKALDFVKLTGNASTSSLQRKFRIGYTRAARIMDMMEERGYVGPAQGSKPREILVGPGSPTNNSQRPAERSNFVADAGDIFPDDDE
jgi:S-DNA-T family DNA segregation ATPase FtsK/SpoIIIE